MYDTMKKFFRYFILVLIIAFVVIQFFQPEKNIQEISANHIFNVEQLPENVKIVLQTACIDCHSNNTSYLWYHKIAPVSWMVNRHIADGKDELNFSEWNAYSTRNIIGMLEAIGEEVESGEMPLPLYNMMHPKAKLNEDQVSVIINWTEKYTESIFD